LAAAVFHALKEPAEMSAKSIFVSTACAISLVTLGFWLDKISSSTVNEAAEEAAGTLVSAKRATKEGAAPPVIDPAAALAPKTKAKIAQ